ncbi:MAG: hypothetical protein HMLKMBBP_00677 [Planctomycetes bacterium]|nr:hypothetical protein [Planctomycetota bacterium]
MNSPAMNRRSAARAASSALALAAAVAGGAVVLALAQAPAAAVAQDKAPARPDRVVWTEGGQQKSRADGRLSAWDWDALQYDAARKASIPATDVVEIVWGDDEDGSYSRGLRLLAEGDGAGARKAFEGSVSSRTALPNIRAWTDEFANCGLGEAWLLIGGADAGAKAADAFGKARAANAKSMITDRILKGAASAELLRKKPDAAVKAADDLAAAGKAAKRPAWELDAYLLKARIQADAGNWAGAMAAFDDASRFAESAAAAEKNEAAKARLRASGIESACGKGWAMCAKADADKSGHDQVRAYFDGLAQKYGEEPAVLGAAQNARGKVKLASGDAKGALREFAKTEVLHFRARTEVARSLWFQAEAMKALGDDAGRTARLKDLKELFPASEFARGAD